MRIVVCLKQVLDPEIPTRDFRWDPTTGRPIQGAARLVIGTFDDCALEVAIQLKEASGGGATVTAITLGDASADDALRKAMSRTADAAVRVWDASWSDLDAPGVAHILARAIQAIGGADLVLCGRQSSDWERSSVGPLLAEELGWPCVSVAARLEIDRGGQQARCCRAVDDGFDDVVFALPATVTITNDASNVPRIARVRDVMVAARKPIRVLGAADLQPSAQRLTPRTQIDDVSVPVQTARCELIPNEDVAEGARRLAERVFATAIGRPSGEPEADTAARIAATGSDAAGGDVLVYTPLVDAAPTRAALEMLAAGHEVAAALGARVSAIAVGRRARSAASHQIARGADRVLATDDPEGQPPNGLIVAAMREALRVSDARVVIFSADAQGRDVAPAVAWHTGVPLITETVSFAHVDGRLTWTRPIYGGKALARMRGLGVPQVVTARLRVRNPRPESPRDGEIVSLGQPAGASPGNIQVVERTHESARHARLEDARVIVAGGRGVGGADGFSLLRELADALGGAVGATRAACDLGWCPPALQIGQTGKAVAPDLYVAVGISGASQHLAGIANARSVVAINTDAQAPIFWRANLGIVADWRAVVPVLTRECRLLRDRGA
ncbi:MAG: hypothetical protein HYY04_06025 [Chloroflexi bacterium]|nr:hypothetical protein [Chloroflexota bacterium]